MTRFIETVWPWLADFYLVATLLIAVILVGVRFISAPGRRMAVIWGTCIGLMIAGLLCLETSRPRVCLPEMFARRAATGRLQNEAIEPVRFSEPTLGSAVLEGKTRHGADAEHVPIVQVPDGIRDAWVPVLDKWPADSFGGQAIATVVVVLLLAGTALMTVRLSLGVLQALRLVWSSTPAPTTLVNELHLVVGNSGRLPRLRINRVLATPVATGALSPTILLPEEIATSESRAELRAVLAHEWAHIRNGDLWLLAVDRCLLLVLWAHPLYWRLRRIMRQDQEYLADAAAAELAGPTDYAAMLVTWARSLAGAERIPVSTTLSIWERPSNLTRRVAAILNENDRMHSRYSGRAHAAIIAGMAVVSLFVGSLSVRPSTTAPATQPAAQPAANPSPKATVAAASPAKSSELPSGRQALDRLLESARAAREGIHSATGSAVFESWARFGDSKDPVLMTRGTMDVRYDRGKYRLKVEYAKKRGWVIMLPQGVRRRNPSDAWNVFRNEVGEIVKLTPRLGEGNPDNVVFVVDDGKSIESITYSSGIHPSGYRWAKHNKLYQACVDFGLQTIDPVFLVRDSGDVEAIVKNLGADAVHVVPLPNGAYRATFLVKGSPKIRVELDASPDVGLNVIAQRVYNEGQIQPAQIDELTWKKIDGVWVVMRSSREAWMRGSDTNNDPRYKKDVVEYRSFHVNPWIDPQGFTQDSMHQSWTPRSAPGDAAKR
jgi:beta-lactamase regulating signal transducer with metallopeptidase domain